MEIKIGKIKVGEEIKIGEIKLGIQKVYPELENLNVRPGVSQQQFNHPNSYGYDKVIVDPIDIRLQNKEITENGTYTADDGFDSLGEVTVAIPDVLEEQLFELEEVDIR